MVKENPQKKCSFFPTIVELNGQNNCIKIFPFSRYKVSLLIASQKDSIFDSQKNPIKCKTLFPVVLQTLKNSLIFLATHRFLEDPLVAAPDYFHNHI